MRHLRVAVAIVVLAGCATRNPATAIPAGPVASAVVHDLASVADLAARFDRDRDHPRVVLLMSPT